MEKDSKIYVCGHNGMVGSAIVRELKKDGYTNIILKSRKELDLTIQQKVKDFFYNEKPEYVFLTAAKVGGIAANIEYPAEFLYENLMIESNVIHYAYETKVKKLLFLGSSCIYPKLSPQPMKEEYLLDGKVEPTNEGYAISKIVGIKLCETYNSQYKTNFISLMPCNIYGTGDNFDPQKSHVVAALIRKFHQAKVNNTSNVEVWGTGNARRELLFVDDLAEACLYFMQNYSSDEFVNIGCGVDLSIKELSETIKKVIGYNGKIIFDRTKPDGMPQKLMSVEKATLLGWEYKTSLEEGLKITYDYFLKNYEK